MNYSTQGYRTNSPDRNNPYNVINSNVISMKGVSQPITAIPIINGKPDYSKRQVLQPEQDDFVFEGAEAVLELPYAQTGLSYMGEIDINGFLPNFNFNTSVIPQTTAPANPIDNSGTVGNIAVTPLDIQPQGVQLPEPNMDITPSLDEARSRMSDEAKRLGIDMEPDQKTGNWWDMFNNIDRTHDLSSSLTRAGYGLGWSADNYDWASPQQKSIARTGNTLATIGAVGNALIKAGKDFFAGRAAANREQQAINEYHEDMSNRMRDRNTYYATYQEGGQIQDEKVLTGGYTTGIPENAPITPTAEVERNEFLLQNDGSVQQVLGNTHEQGGELMDLEAGTRIISDHLKIGGEFSKRLNKDFDLNTRAKETYAKAIEKYRKKIGLQKVLDEYQEVIGKIKDQEETEHTQTREINLSFLAQRVQELEAQKAPLEEELSKFTEFVFQEQESKKEETQPTSSYQDGGEVQQILQTYSQVTGIPFEQLLQEFNSLSEQEQQILLQEILQELQGAQQQQQQTDPEQVIQAYAQETGTDPNQIVQQLQQMPPEQQQQALAQMEQELQQPQQQYRKGGNVPKYQETGVVVPIIPDNIYGFGTPNFSFNFSNNPLTSPTNQTYRTSQYPVEYEGVAYNEGDRRDIELEPNEYYGDFVLRNPWARVEAEAQRRNSTGQGFGDTNVSETLSWYSQNTPYLIQGFTQDNNGQLSFIPEKGTVERFQKRYDEMSSDTGNLFKDEYGYDAESVDRYIEDIKFEPNREFGESSRRYDDKYGRFTSSRSWFQRPIVTPEQLEQLHAAGLRTARQVLEENPEKAKEILGDKYEEVVRGLDKYKNADYVIGALQEQPSDTTGENTPTATTSTSTTNPYTASRSNQQMNLPWSEIDQRIPFPMGMDIGRMQSVSPINLRPVNVSVEPALNEINRQVTFANQMANFAPDSTRAAQIANLVATGTDASNQAITANNLQNAQLNQQVEQFNELQIGAADKMNTELAENYTERFLRTKAALESQQAGWYQYMNRLAAQQQQNQFNRNIAQSMFPNMRLNPDGTITGIGSPIEIYQNLLNQQQQKGKTQTAQKGGTIKDHLKLTMFKNKK